MRTQFKTEKQHERGMTALRRYISEYEEIERKQQEEKPLVSNTRNRTAAKLRKDAISISTRDGKFININQQMSDLLGYDMDEMIGMDIRKICANPVDLDRLQREIDQKGYIISNRLNL